MCYFIISFMSNCHACMENRNDSHLQLSQIRSMEESGIPQLEEREEDGVADEHPHPLAELAPLAGAEVVPHSRTHTGKKRVRITL